MMVFMSLVLVLIGQFCRDVIGHQNVKVVVIGQLLLLLFSIRLLFVCRFRGFAVSRFRISHQQQSL